MLRPAMGHHCGTGKLRERAGPPAQGPVPSALLPQSYPALIYASRAISQCNWRGVQIHSRATGACDRIPKPKNSLPTLKTRTRMTLSTQCLCCARTRVIMCVCVYGCVRQRVWGSMHGPLPPKHTHPPSLPRRPACSVSLATCVRCGVLLNVLRISWHFLASCLATWALRKVAPSFFCAPSSDSLGRPGAGTGAQAQPPTA